MSSAKPRRRLRNEAANFLTEQGFPIAATTLAKLACVGGGPVFSHWGRKPIYDEDDLLAWAQTRFSKPKSSTSDTGAI